ncbi:hypothetical protein UACE39S_04792 [Ureibacillus acetophenoni]
MKSKRAMGTTRYSIYKRLQKDIRTDHLLHDLIGFALKEKQDDGETYKTVGKMGLELFYNKELTGVDGSMQYKSDAFHYLLPNSEQMIKPAQNGSDIYLTIDKTIQNFLEESMTSVI